MPRVLTVQRTTVPLAERARYIERMRELAAHYAASNCRFAFSIVFGFVFGELFR